MDTHKPEGDEAEKKKKRFPRALIPVIDRAGMIAYSPPRHVIDVALGLRPVKDDQREREQ